MKLDISPLVLMGKEYDRDMFWWVFNLLGVHDEQFND